MILKDDKNDFENDYLYFYLNDFNELEKQAILKYLNIERIGMDISPSRDFSYKRKENENITLIKAKCYRLDEFKEYTIVLKNDHLFGGFDSGEVYLIYEKNILSINNSNLEHYHISYDEMQLVNRFPINLKFMSIRNFAKKHIIINGRIYNLDSGTFTTPEFDEIITPGDYNDSDSIIFAENICPKELRTALQNVVENGDVSLGIKQVTADEPLIDLEKEEYIKTIVICVIDKFNNCMDDYFYYDSVNNKIMSKKRNKFTDITSEVKKELNSITDFLNRMKAKELENSLYVDITKKISSILPEESRKKLESKNIFKKYKNNNQ